LLSLFKSLEAMTLCIGCGSLKRGMRSRCTLRVGLVGGERLLDALLHNIDEAQAAIRLNTAD
jgi:hypothetical protein